MPGFDAKAAFPGNQPGPWGDRISVSYSIEDVLLYAVGIGIRDLRYIYEGNNQFAVFPTFPIRWGSAGAPFDPGHIPSSRGPLDLDAERYLESMKPLPVSGTVTVASRMLGAHPRGKGNALVEYETIVRDADGDLCVRMVNGSFRRGVHELGDIEPFEGAGLTMSEKVQAPKRLESFSLKERIPDNQAAVYRLSGDFNPLHIDPEAAGFGGFSKPILHGLCTFGYCTQLLLEKVCSGDPLRFKRVRVRFSAPVFPGDNLELRAWEDGVGRVIFEALVDDRVVVSSAYFEFD